MSDTIYQFGTVKDTRHKDFDLKSLHGKGVLIVNIASKCGQVGQLAELQGLHDKFCDQGFTVLAFPCNQFLGQEPLEFPVMDKIDVNGSSALPLYEYLKGKAPGIMGLKVIKWFGRASDARNYEKFLISREGKVVARFGTHTHASDIEPHVAKVLSDSG
ncbi:hypothetical protein HDU91_004901 [Kappamyces sp. JEL0680]|nr:hypothetical protein HDU91_004901 [Kappamyces sp. JEL0680]